MNKEVQIAKSNSDYKIISDLASIIWVEHYTSIIGSEQVTYMLNKFQSVSAIKKQVKENYNYFVLLFDEKPVGYLSFVAQQNSLFVSKVYVLEKYRGKGIGRFVINFINEKATEQSLKSISLTVNKYNTKSIKFYEKIGFKNMESLVIDIGGGFVMDDYRLVKEL